MPSLPCAHLLKASLQAIRPTVAQGGAPCPPTWSRGLLPTHKFQPSGLQTTSLRVIMRPFNRASQTCTHLPLSLHPLRLPGLSHRRQKHFEGKHSLTLLYSDVDTITVLQSLRFYSCPPHTHFRKHVTPHANICSPMHSSSSTVPIAPKRKKRMTMFPEQLEDVAPPRPPKVCNVYIWVGNQRDL